VARINSVPLHLSWSATDEETAADDLVHQLQRRRLKNGAWQNIGTFTDAQALTSLPLWRWYQYRVRSQDEAGTWSEWAYSKPVKYFRRSETNFTRSAGWTRPTMAGAMGGRVARSSTVGATARLKFTGDGVALVMPAGAGQGSIEACIDPGKPAEDCRVIDLAAFTPTGPRRLVVVFADLALAEHVLRVRVVSGTVNLDGAIFSR
jgi:hypothetical protein